ncbi:MAG: FtsW/RodA/SpoVE family cell cycle protein [Rickettsiales bacterium]|jgi:cell division protein FtsW|nr:FtsW/RodA/SpoVE family cell cycle protein [Rickettsiales bacterium]
MKKNMLKNWFEKTNIDRKFRILLIMILIIGLIMVFAAYPYTRAGYTLVKKFFAYAAISLFAMKFFATLDKKNIIRISVLGFLSMFFAMLLLPIIGTTIKGSTRWISLPFFSLQPAEILKPFYCVVATLVILHIKKMLQKYGTWKNKNIISVAGFYAAITGIILIFLYKQPDVGMMFTFIFIVLVQLFISGLKLKYMAILAMISSTFLILGYMNFNHVHNRINEFFLMPLSSDTQQGIAIRVIKESGLIGGSNSALLKQYVPDLHTDFIFAAICEVGGFIMATIVITVLFMFIIRGFRLLRNYSDDDFKSVSGGGILGFLSFQIIINLLVNLAMFPPKGMILPFISYGGSGYLSVSIAVGILISMFRLELPKEIQIADIKITDEKRIDANE